MESNLVDYKKLFKFLPSIVLKSLINLGVEEKNIIKDNDDNFNLSVFPLKKTFDNTIILKIKIHGLISSSLFYLFYLYFYFALFEKCCFIF